MSNKNAILENGKLENRERVKYLLNDLLDEIDYLSLHDQKDKVITTILYEIDNQIRKENNMKKIMELSRDIEQFFKQGGDYNSLECRIKHAPIIEDCDSIMNIYDVYLENVYKFILFEAFICRDTLLENEEIKEMVNNKLIKQIIESTHDMPEWFNNEIKEINAKKPDDQYRWLNSKIMAAVFYNDEVMTKELKERLFKKEYEKTNTNRNENIAKIRNKKNKLLKLKILLGAMILGGVISLGSVAYSVKVSNTHSVTYEDDSKSLKLLIGLILAMVLGLCANIPRVKLLDLRKELELDEEHYKKLCTLLEQLNLIENDIIDVNKVKTYLLHNYPKTYDTGALLVDSNGRIVLPDDTRTDTDKTYSKMDRFFMEFANMMSRAIKNSDTKKK